MSKKYLKKYGRAGDDVRLRIIAYCSGKYRTQAQITRAVAGHWRRPLLSVYLNELVKHGVLRTKISNADQKYKTVPLKRREAHAVED